jgi:hypothetical protein
MTTALADASLPIIEIGIKYLPTMFSDASPSELKDEFLTIVPSDFHPNGFRAMIKHWLWTPVICFQIFMFLPAHLGRIRQALSAQCGGAVSQCYW